MRTKRPFNVLVTSLSRKVALVREVRKALEKFAQGSRVFGADSDTECIGRYFVDSFWRMPPLEELHMDELLDFCAKHRIQAIIPTRDDELEYFADIFIYVAV